MVSATEDVESSLSVAGEEAIVKRKMRRSAIDRRPDFADELRKSRCCFCRVVFIAASDAFTMQSYL